MKFDIHKEPERFVKVLAGYALMSDTELGLNTFIKRNGSSKYIVVPGARITLEDKPIASTKAIVCKGTTCYRGTQRRLREWEHCVKFAWPSDKRQREGDLLKLAKERGVKVSPNGSITDRLLSTGARTLLRICEEA
jgi:Fungal protein kinase